MSLDYLLELDRSDVDMRSLRPSKYFVRKVVNRVCRQGDIKRPGFIVIPQTRALFGTIDRSKKFNMRMLEAFKGYLTRNKPHLLRHNIEIRGTTTERRNWTKNDALILREHNQVSGLERGAQYFHFDFPSQIYCSILYGQKKNVRGGITKLFDVKRLAHDNKSALRDYVKFYPMRFFGEEAESMNDRTLQGAVDARILVDNKEYLTKLNFINNNQWPIIMFSNRYEDGILHTATLTQKRDTNGPAPIRNMYHAALQYQPLE